MRAVVDASTSAAGARGCDVGNAEVAAAHPGRPPPSSPANAAAPSARWRRRSPPSAARRAADVGGVIGAGGSGRGSAGLAGAAGMPVGLPKLLVCTLASGDVRAFVGSSDIMMLYPVVDVSGLNRISRQVLANAARRNRHGARVAAGTNRRRPAVGLTMFGVTTPCVQAVTALLEADYDCIVFHATGTGGQSMEKLAASGLLAAVLDLTTTEIADELVGGVLSAGPQRLEVFASPASLRRLGRRARHGRFWARDDSVPAKFTRLLHSHNAR